MQEKLPDHCLRHLQNEDANLAGLPQEETEARLQTMIEKLQGRILPIDLDQTDPTLEPLGSGMHECADDNIYIYIHIDIYLGILVSHSQLSQLFLSDIYIHTHFHIINPDSYPGLHENPFSLVCPAGFTTVSKKRTDDRLRCKFNAVNDCVFFYICFIYMCDFQWVGFDPMGSK